MLQYHSGHSPDLVIKKGEIFPTVTLFSLTVMTMISVAENFEIELISSEGLRKPINPSTVYIILANAWTAFFLSLVLSVLYHALHPSQVDLVHLKEKFVVEIFGFEINFVEKKVKGILKFYLARKINSKIGRFGKRRMGEMFGE